MIDGNQIEHVSSFNYLGITLDTNLSYNIHIESIKTSIARTMGSLNCIKRIIPPRILKQIYLTLIQPKILYGLVIWGHNAHKLHRLQKRAVRIITCSKYNAHTDPLFKELNILKITDLYNLQICKLFYKITNGYIPIYFKQLYSNSIMPPHQYSFRTMNCLPVTFCRLSQTQNCTKIKIAKTINNLQQAVFEKKIYTQPKRICLLLHNSYSGLIQYCLLLTVLYESRVYKTATYAIVYFFLLTKMYFQIL